MISVALCTYNGEKYIRQQLDSILAQTMPVDEIVIHDDCSTDSTYRILNDYANRFPQIKVSRNDFNVGFVKNFENALVECQGDYIFFSDQDDIWMKDKVALTVNYLKKTGMFGAFSNGHLIDENGKKINCTLFSVQNLVPYIERGLLDRYIFEILCLKGNFVTGAALTITKSAKKLVLPFRTSKYILHDMWIGLSLSSKHKLGYIDKPLISYRIHSEQECGLNMESSMRREFLLEAFAGGGNCRDLMERRRGSAAIVYYCKLNKDSQRILYRMYSNLFFCSLKNSSNKIKDKILYYFNELYARANAKFGFRV